MSSTNSIEIFLTSETVSALKEGEYELQVFRGTDAASTVGGKPTVLFTTQLYLNNTTMTFEVDPEVSGYFIVSETGVLSTMVSREMKLGDTLTLNRHGDLILESSGIPGAYLLKSELQDRKTSGLIITSPSEPGQGSICAFPQYAATANVLKPSGSVLVVFSNVSRAAGDEVETLFSTSALVNFSSKQDDTVKLNFDLNKGWNANGNSIVTIYPVNSNIASILIKSSQDLSTELLKMP